MKKKKVRAKKKQKFSFIPIGLVIVALVVIGLVAIVYEKPVVIIELPAPPPGAIEIDSCMLLNQAGAYYVLNTSIEDINGVCFSIEADDITLDGMGNSIKGNFTGNGIQVTAANSVIQQINVRNFDIGIALLAGSQGRSLLNVNSFYNVQADIYDIYAIYAQIKTKQDAYLPGEQVEITDASELGE